jgi:hypothetical protein
LKYPIDPYAPPAALAGPEPDPCACGGEPVTLANLVTVAGYALGVWWTQGGPPWAAVASIVADEVDGRLARSMGEASCLGGTLDWATDVVLTGLTAHKLGWTPAVPVLTAGQVYLRAKGWRPSVGSARALMMAYGLWKERQERRR